LFLKIKVFAEIEYVGFTFEIQGFTKYLAKYFQSARSGR
tara:strand:+ start:338 stop:454 length:117 start_codon:yes stop_codon:yes gene_type:complete